jgi:hypothetical protein
VAPEPWHTIYRVVDRRVTIEQKGRDTLAVDIEQFQCTLVLGPDCVVVGRGRKSARIHLTAVQHAELREALLKANVEGALALLAGFAGDGEA